MQDQTSQKITVHALKTSAYALALLTIVLFYAKLSTWALGFLIGGALSLFSMFSLTVIVPFLFQPGVGGRAKGLLSLTLFMKLPLYGAGLYVVSRGEWVDPRGAGIGIVLVPAVLTGYAIRQAFADARAETEAAREKAARKAVLQSPFPAKTKTTPTATTPVFALHHKQNKQTEFPAKTERRTATPGTEVAPKKQVTPVREGV